MEHKANIISLGAGLQSTALCYMSEMGLIERADHIVFSDTGAEPDWVYETLERVRRDISIPIEIITHGNLERDVLEKKRYSAPPFYIETESGGMPMRRQCTVDYKILPIRRWIKKNFGKCNLFIGISLDEAQRARFSQVRFIEHVYPLIDLRMTRQSCISFFETNNIQVPAKSSCYFCPYHNDFYWLKMKTDYPDLFQKACEFDEKIRDRSQLIDGKKQYLHKSCKPIAQVEFKHERQYNLEFSCSGGCGI